MLTSVVYLVLTFTTVSSGVAVEKIPQANMNQCLVNLKNYSGTWKGEGDRAKVFGKCITGVVEK